MTIIILASERQGRMRLADGRLLAWSEWGPPDGLPVLFCPGAGMSGALGFAAHVLPELGVRLLAIDRPGLGHSDPHPGKTLASWVADTQAWSAANEFVQLGAVGFSHGAPFAFALAAHGLVAALAIVSGQDELAHPRIRPLLHPEVEQMVAAVEQDPVGFEDAVAARATPEGLWQLIMDMSSAPDLVLYRGEALQRAFRQALGEGFAQGSHSYARDLVNSLRRWPFELERIAVPIDLWYGAQDTSSVHSPDRGATLAARLPLATHTLDPAQGGALLWTRAHELLEQLRTRIGNIPEEVHHG
jgi:pimeloyl-ACP methyl ester carboxylesterase